MPWYYAGPEAKPIGPVSLEELQARRLNGTISPETYVIEHTGQPDESRAWRRHQEVFPVSPALPPIPVDVQPAAPPPPHPLFPSAVGASIPKPGTPFPSQPIPQGPTNPSCDWGFKLGVASLILLIPTCGLSALLAFVAAFVSLVGLSQVHQRPDQTGHGRALLGLLFSGVTILLTLVLVVLMAFAIPKIKVYEQTTTEQSTNDSE